VGHRRAWVAAEGGGLRVWVRVGVRVSGSEFRGGEYFPWPPDLEGGPGAVAGPAVVAECGRNGARWRRRPPRWWRRPVGQGRQRG
jgi:hypothetical protein